MSAIKQQYWVNQYFVDLTRNQIHQNDDIQLMPPKALAVLTYLAEHQGKVVSHDALMDKVWQGSIVSSNTLQRSIVQLRKALGDDSKSQSIIKTHAKQGYSLEAKVDWRAETPSTLNSVIEGRVDRRKRFAIFVTIALAAFVTLFSLQQVNSPTERFDHLASVTFSDEKEFMATYSNDGRYVLFHRYLGMCQNNIWAKNLATQQQHQLTKEYGIYDRHSLSADGENLVFMGGQACDKNIQPKACLDLMTLDLNLALVNPQAPKIRLDCKNAELTMPNWLNDGSIVALKKSPRQWSLVKLPAGSEQLIELYAPANKKIYSLTYSPFNDLMAVISINIANQHLLEIFDNQGTIISSAIITRPKTMSPVQRIYPSFDPKQNRLVFSSGKQLFSMTFEGDISQISIPTQNNIYHPSLHPQENKLLVTHGVFDNDIAQIQLGQPNKSKQVAAFNEVFQPYPSIARSIFSDRQGRYAPSGNAIAFISERSGTAQLWLSQDDQLRQLTQFETDTQISGLAWSESGDTIMTAANGELFTVTTGAKVSPVATELAITQLFQWHGDELLLKVDVSGETKLVSYDLVKGTINELFNGDVKWAAVTPKGKLVYLDTENNYWQMSSSESVVISQLADNSSTGYFLLKNDNIYNINNEGQLWLYNTTNAQFQIIQNLHSGISYLNDIQGDRLLFTQKISARKEIVELSVSIN